MSNLIDWFKNSVYFNLHDFIGCYFKHALFLCYYYIILKLAAVIITGTKRFHKRF